MQTLNNDDCFPSFDYRVCLYCKKNDITSPNLCKYENYKKPSLSNSNNSNIDEDGFIVTKEHTYG